MSQFEIPKGWELKNLGELSEEGSDTFTDGPFGSNLKVSDYTNSGIPIIRLQNIGEGTFYSSNLRYTSEKKFQQLQRHAAYPGDVLIAKMAEPVARACVLSPEFDKFMISADCIKLRPDRKKTSARYLAYVINSPFVREQAEKQSKGITRLRINLGEVKKLIIPIPSLPIQEKIVKKLDYIFTQLEKKKNAIFVLHNKLENSIITLHDQISGELITKYYSSERVITHSKIMKLSDVCFINPSKNEISNLNNNLEVTFLPMRAVDDIEGRIKAPEIRVLKEVKKGYTYFRENDVILAKITPCMENGKAALCTGLRNEVGFGSTEFHVLRSKGNTLPEWIYYFVRQNKFRKDAKSSMKGSAGQQRVPASFVESCLIPIPSISIQKEIIQQIKESTDFVNFLKIKINSILINIQKNKEYLEHLQTSILDKAFSGKLVN